MTLYHSPNIVKDGLVLYLDAANKKSFIEDKNILNLSSWVVGEGAISGFSLNGSTTENYRIITTDPWGDSNIIWEARPDATSGADGGWNGSTFPIDNTKMYRFSVWVRRTVTGNGSFYLGLYGYGSTNGVLHRDNVSTNNTNPYFWSGGISAGEWRLVVGHVWPANSGTGSIHEDSGQYTISGGRIANISRDYVWRTETTTSMHRSYLYYSTDINTRQQWIYPRVDVVDGSEPSIGELLSNGPNTWNNLMGSNFGTSVSLPAFTPGSHFSFNGSGKRSIIESPFGQAGKTTITIGYRRNETTSSTTWRTLLGHASSNIHHLISNSSSRNLGIFDGSFRDFGYNPPQDSKFHIYNIIYTSGSSATLYIDGNQGNTVSTTLNLTTNPIGSIGNWGGSNYWAGDISFVQIYNRQLLDSEIKENFNALRGRYGI